MNSYEKVHVTDIKVGDRIVFHNIDSPVKINEVVNREGVSITLIHEKGEEIFTKYYIDMYEYCTTPLLRVVENKKEPPRSVLLTEQEWFKRIATSYGSTVAEVSGVLQTLLEPKSERVNNSIEIDSDYWEYVAMMYGITVDEAKEALQSISRKKETPKEELKSIMERVKTWEDACVIEVVKNGSLDPHLNELLTITTENKEMIAIRDYARMRLVAKVLNEGWEPDWNNHNQKKYYPWFEASPGVGFSYDVFVFDPTYSGVGSRLCFKSRELAEYAGKQFIDLYNSFLK